MIYLQRVPADPLKLFVSVIWYVRETQPSHPSERVLPSGRAQIVLNMARDFLLDGAQDAPQRRTAPELIVGQRSLYGSVDTSDFADLIGIVFAPGALPIFASESADNFSNRNVALEDLWGGSARTLRDSLREKTTPRARLQFLEAFLLRRLASRLSGEVKSTGAETRRKLVQFALKHFALSSAPWSVREVARSVGRSERRFSQVFREEVGFSPREWCRIQRFQRVVKLLDAGAEVPWSQVALDCGFYDQSHFSNEFRAFSGINPTTYLAQQRRWTNHVHVD